MKRYAKDNMPIGYTYLLECVDGSYYTGSTTNLERRLREHQNMKGANFTKKKHPVKLVYFETYDRIQDAFYREKQIQGWTHKKKKALVEGRNDLLPELAKKVFRGAVASIQSPSAITQPPGFKESSSAITQPPGFIESSSAITQSPGFKESSSEIT